VGGLLADRDRAHRLGVAAHAQVQDRFLGDGLLVQYAEIFATLL
jgi:hypothetical protein